MLSSFLFQQSNKQYRIDDGSLVKAHNINKVQTIFEDYCLNQLAQTLKMNHSDDLKEI